MTEEPPSGEIVRALPCTRTRQGNDIPPQAAALTKPNEREGAASNVVSTGGRAGAAPAPRRRRAAGAAVWVLSHAKAVHEPAVGP
mgnify:CR=1 FL=1